MSKREQRLVWLGVSVLGLALLWWVAVAPALKVLQTAPQQHAALDAQLQQMQQLQAQVQALRDQPVLKADVVRAALQDSVRQLGTETKMAQQGERVTLTLQNTTPQELATWLARVRQNAHLSPFEAHLTRNPAGTWNGTLVLQLPAP